MAFGRLKERRYYKGMTQKDVAELLGVQRATYAGWETGKDIIPLRKLFILANHYQLSMDYLVGLSNQDSKSVSKVKEIDIELVANNLKKTRKEKGLTQIDISLALQTSQSNIHKYETAKCLITTMYALEFVKQFDYSLDKMFGRK